MFRSKNQILDPQEKILELEQKIDRRERRIKRCAQDYGKFALLLTCTTTPLKIHAAFEIYQQDYDSALQLMAIAVAARASLRPFSILLDRLDQAKNRADKKKMTELDAQAFEEQRRFSSTGKSAIMRSITQRSSPTHAD